MKKFLSLVLALVMTMSLVTVSAGAKDFTDNGSITYKEAVEVMSAVGVIDGYTDGSFQPTTNLTRGAAAKIICNLILGPTTAAALGADTAPYSDVPVTNTFAGYIAYCQKEKIISGYADGTFRPSAPLTGYAFMKMLLGALGYDSAKEGYTGANWSVNVAKQAIAIGLADGNDDFVGQASVNREEAMLYAFNAMQATMVEYANDTTIVVGDVTVSSAGKASEVANTASIETIKNDNKMQFAERYFSDLKLVDGTDAFSRPANIWKVKSDEVGTYPKTADATYTEKVEVGTIYKDLGLGKTVSKSDVSVYEDGKAITSGTINAPVAIAKGSEAEFGGNGVLTQVYYNTDDETVTITLVNTYVGTINRTVEASGNNDRYIEVNPESTPESGVSNRKFETNEEFEDDAYVLYTYSVTDKAIQSVKTAESVDGTVTKIVAGKSINLGDTTYKFSVKNAGDAASVDSDYTVYLDEYGYAIYVEEQEFVSGDFALVLAIEGSNTSGFSTNRAKLVFGDGSVKTVTTVKDYVNGSTKIAEGSIVTYKVDDNNEYTLKYATTKKQDTANKLTLEQGKALIDVNGSSVYANSKTVFVVKNGSSYDVYTGINNAPTIKATGTGTKGAEVYWYEKTDKMASIIFIIPGSDVTVENSKNNVLFVAGESASKLVSTSDGDYYEYNAVVNGEVTTIKVDSGLKNAGKLGNGVYGSYSTDTKGIITNLTGYNTNKDESKYTDMKVGTAKVSGDYTITLGGVAFTVAEDAKLYKVDEDGNIGAISLNNVTKDENDLAYYVVADGQIAHLFIVEVDDSTPITPDQGELKSVVASQDGGVKVTVTLSANATTTGKAQVQYYNVSSDKYINIGAAMTLTFSNTDTATATLPSSQLLSGSNLYQVVVTMADGSTMTSNNIAASFS